MKSKIISFILCVAMLAATISLVYYEPNISETQNTFPDENNSSEIPNNTSETEMSRNYVIQTAHDAENFLTRLSYGTDKEYKTSLSRLAIRLNSCSQYLKDELKDFYGASYFSKIASIFQDIQNNPFTDSASFSTRVGKFLTELENTYPKNTTVDENHPTAPMYYPKFDTSVNGTVSLAFLAIYRQQSTQDGKSILLTFGGNLLVGDTLLGSQAADSFKNQQAASPYPYPLYTVSSILGTDTASFANLASPLTNSTATSAIAGTIKGSPSYAIHLKNAGIDVVSVSDQKLLSYGEIGKTDTLAALKNAGIGFSDEGTVSFYETSLGTVAFLTYNIIDEIYSNVNVTYSEAPRRDIAAAKSLGAKFVVVHFNWLTTEHNQWDPCMGQVNSARAAVDNGANLVIGTHPNAIAALEQYKNVNIIYSPGNLSNKQGENNPSFNFQQAFSLDANGNAVAGEIQVIPLAGASSGSGVPSLVLDPAGANQFRETIIYSSQTLRNGLNKKPEFLAKHLNLIAIQK